MVRKKKHIFEKEKRRNKLLPNYQITDVYTIICREHWQSCLVITLKDGTKLERQKINWKRRKRFGI